MNAVPREAVVAAGARRPVLIVEDDPGIAELVLERLVELGCDCRVVPSGRAAIAALAEARPELLVLDYSLPDMRADELLERVGPIPFMIATGRGDEALAVKLMRAGARDYLIKDGGFLDELPVVAARVLRELDTERRLEEARSDLEAKLRENQAMLREIHHRVKNNLQIISSLVRLQTPPDSRSDVKELFSAVQGRIGAMALVHETLYESGNLGRVDFRDYLLSLVHNLDSAIAPADVELRIECEGVSLPLPIDVAVPLGLIANELITNALKHGFPPGWGGPARITASTLALPGGKARLEIADSGVGMSCVELEPVLAGREAGRLGLHLVRILADQIDAEVACAGGEGGGTVWSVDFPSRS